MDHPALMKERDEKQANMGVYRTCEKGFESRDFLSVRAGETQPHPPSRRSVPPTKALFPISNNGSAPQEGRPFLVHRQGL